MQVQDRLGRLLRLFSAVLILVISGCASRHYYDASTQMTENPADRGLDYEAITFTSLDGTRLSAWYVPAVKKSVATVLHFHGKADNMSNQLSFVDWLPAQGFNVFLFDYRGFGKSQGHPSPKGVHQDALAALEYVRSRNDLDANRLLVFAQSLGGAIAIAALAEDGADGINAVVTESTLSSYRLVVRDQIGKMGFWSFLKWPLSWLIVNNQYSPDKFIEQLAPIPILLIHGDDDQGIAPYHCQRLFEKAREPKQQWIVEGGHHLDTFTAQRKIYRPLLVEYFLQALADRASKR